MKAGSGDWERRSRILVTCARGTTDLLRNELSALGFVVSGEMDSGVFTEGNLLDAMRMNLWLRTAHRVHWQLGTLSADTPDELYRGVKALPWEHWIDPDGYLTVSSIVHNATIRDFRFANQKCKDAICDRMRAICKRRPDSGPEMRGVSVFVFWAERDVTIYLDTTGEALSKRGYRLRTVQAPMQETLAAAVVAATEWRGRGHFINPMCGSGTLAIEAALLCSNRAPALTRKQFAFMFIRGYDASAWTALRNEARRKVIAPSEIQLVASDRDATAVAAARMNAEAAGVAELIRFSVCDFSETPMPDGGGVVVLNPEYGRRMGETQALIPVYRRIGDFLKKCGPTWRGYVFTGNAKLFNKVSLKPNRQWTFFSGGIECRLLEFQIYAGRGPFFARNNRHREDENRERKR